MAGYPLTCMERIWPVAGLSGVQFQRPVSPDGIRIVVIQWKGRLGTLHQQVLGVRGKRAEVFGFA